MIAFLDHDEFVKTRKALLIASITLLTLVGLEVQGDNVSFLGLEISFDKDLFVAGLKIANAYLLFVFLLQAVGLVTIQRKAQIERKYRTRADEILQLHRAEHGNAKPRNMLDFNQHEQARIDEMEKDLDRHATSIGRFYDNIIALIDIILLAFIKIFAPGLIAYLALTDFDFANWLKAV